MIAEADANLTLRVIGIGDLHGSLDGLQDILFSANITISKDSCLFWNPSARDTIVVQVGDIVDRGEYAAEAWFCLEELQRNPPQGSKVVRLVGNHDIWWLEGNFGHRNKRTE